MPDDEAQADGCELDFGVKDQLTADGEQVDALVMFADCWDDDEAVQRRKAELEELSAAGYEP